MNEIDVGEIVSVDVWLQAFLTEGVSSDWYLEKVDAFLLTLNDDLNLMILVKICVVNPCLVSSKFY